MTDVLEPSTTPAELYLDLLKKSLTRYIFPESAEGVETVLQRRTLRWAFYRAARPILALKNLDVVPRRALFDPNLRAIGRDSPKYAETMVGLKRLENIQYCTRNILRDEIPGDLIETGAWRGGACIFMRAILRAYGDLERKVWVADSFKGLPKPDFHKFPVDAGDIYWTLPYFSVSLEEVKANFERYGMLDDQVRFLPGWFRDTLPNAPIDRLALLRLDGDLYESTMEALMYLYPKLSVGGYVIIDDYGAHYRCKEAVDDFRKTRGIDELIQEIDWTGIFWKRER